MDKKLKVLIVEDNRADFELMKHVLRDESGPKYTLAWVDTIAKAKEKLNTGSFDAVLLDMNLPDSYRLEGLRELAGHYPDTPIVLMTGMFRDHDFEIEAMKSGATSWIQKGVMDRARLEEAIDYAIQRFHILMGIPEIKEDVPRGEEALGNIDNLIKLRQQAKKMGIVRD